MRVRRRIEVERGAVELAERQHGVVARRQLERTGLSGHVIDHRVRMGRLHPVHRGVYAVGHRRIAREGRWMAAVLVAGDDAVLSHRSAARLWGLLPDGPGPIDVTVPASRRDRPGVAQHQASLSETDRVVEGGIPVTSLPRTLLDLAAGEDDRTLRRALHEAEVARPAVRAALVGLLRREGGRRGVARLRRLLAGGDLGRATTRSELELRFLELLIDRGLPLPRANVPLTVEGRRIEVDLAWPRSRLAVELDGHATHRTRAKFERDRERDRALQAAGWRVVRVTWRQLHEEPDAVLADLRRLLGARAAPPAVG